MLEEAGVACRGNVLSALGHVGGGGVSQDPFAHVLNDAEHIQLPAAPGVLELLALPVPDLVRVLIPKMGEIKIRPIFLHVPKYIARAYCHACGPLRE